MRCEAADFPDYKQISIVLTPPGSQEHTYSQIRRFASVGTEKQLAESTEQMF